MYSSTFGMYSTTGVLEVLKESAANDTRRAVGTGSGVSRAWRVRHLTQSLWVRMARKKARLKYLAPANTQV